MLAERLYHEKEKWVGAWNFGPQDDCGITVATLCDMIIRLWGEGSWQVAPEHEAPHEAHFLKLDCSKARQILGWHQRWDLEEAVAKTVDWYRKALSLPVSGNMYDFTCEQIREYEKYPKTERYW
jgi:CDP-glucose 4,6-dehydratase